MTQGSHGVGVYIGVLGGMVDCHFLTGMSVKQEDRVVAAGGAGTLAPRRFVSWGPSAREWSCDLSHAAPSELAALQALVYRQHVQGGAYRMLAVDAQWQNAFTPAASMDFTGWSGDRTVSATYSALVEVRGGGTMLYPTTELSPEFYLEHGGASHEVRHTAAFTVDPATAATQLSSPVVPVIPGKQVTLGIFAQGDPVLRAQWVDAAGANILSPVTVAGASHTDLRRLTGSVVPPASAHGVRVLVDGGTRYAWPSVTWTPGPRPYATGRGAESVVLSPVDESLILATADRQLSSWQYTIQEVT